jgi:hypothetical protein
MRREGLLLPGCGVLSAAGPPQPLGTGEQLFSSRQPGEGGLLLVLGCGVLFEVVQHQPMGTGEQLFRSRQPGEGGLLLVLGGLLLVLGGLLLVLGGLLLPLFLELLTLTPLLTPLGFLYDCLELLGDFCVVFREVEVGAVQLLHVR